MVEKKCTSNRDNRTLERIVKQNPFKNVGEIHKEWTAAGVSASRTTTHRRMQDMGFSCRIPCVKPLLNNRQRQKRLAWAKDKKDWTAAEWSKVMFSDESKFCISYVLHICILHLHTNFKAKYGTVTELTQDLWMSVFLRNKCIF